MFSDIVHLHHNLAQLARCDAAMDLENTSGSKLEALGVNVVSQQLILSDSLHLSL